MGISALVVTKLDGTARGGFVVSIVSDLGVPVKLIGVGESLYDLRDFEPVLYVDSLLGYSVSLLVGVAVVTVLLSWLSFFHCRCCCRFNSSS